MEARNDKKESLEERRGKHLPSCRTTRNETRKGTRQKNNFSCRQRISNCWEDCLLASDECGLPAPSPSRADTWRSPCNLPRQNPGTPCARSIRILKNRKNLSIVEKKKFSTPSVVEFMEDIPMLVENITVIKNKKRNLLSQCMDRLSSSRLRQTLQNFLLWCTCSDQQCATGFCVQQNKTSFISHFSFFFLSFSHRNALQRKKLRDIPFLPSFLKLNYRGEKKKISDFSNDDRPRLFLFELLFFFAEEKKEELAH